jgi:hypothetical protein
MGAARDGGQPELWQPSAPWRFAPEHEIGVALPIERVLATGPEFHLRLLGFVAYRVGFKIWVASLQNGGPSPGMRARVVAGHDQDASATLLRLGVEFADGRRASTEDEFVGQAWRIAKPPQPPIALSDMTDIGGHLDGGRVGVWVWPLPPPGPLTISVEWEAIELPRTQIEIDAAPIAAAGAGSEQLWSDDPTWVEGAL